MTESKERNEVSCINFKKCGSKFLYTFLFNVMTLFSFDTISLSTGTINIELKIDCYEIA